MGQRRIVAWIGDRCLGNTLAADPCLAEFLVFLGWGGSLGVHGTDSHLTPINVS